MIDQRDKLTALAAGLALLLLMAVYAYGCSLARVEEGGSSSRSTGRAEARPSPGGVAVPVTRDPLPAPEMPEWAEQAPAFAVAAPEKGDDREALALKKELAALAAEVERLKAETAAAAYKALQGAKEELQAARESRDQAAALASESARAATYDANRWLWAVVAAAIAAVAYAYKRLSLTAALLSLGGFGFLFALVLAGQHFPRAVALSPIPFILLLTYAAWRYGVVRRALVACAKGIELADNDVVKTAVRWQPGSEGVETVRKEIDQATVELARARARARRQAAKGDAKGDDDAKNTHV